MLPKEQRMLWTRVSQPIVRFLPMVDLFRLVGDELKNKPKQMKDNAVDAGNAAKDKLGDGAQHVKEGTEKGLYRFQVIRRSKRLLSAVKNAKQAPSDAADKAKEKAAQVGNAVSDGKQC